MINKSDEGKTILFNENLIGTHPYLMKELIMRGYRVIGASPSHMLSDTQVKTVQKKEILIERGLRI